MEIEGQDWQNKSETIMLFHVCCGPANVSWNPGNNKVYLVSFLMSLHRSSSALQVSHKTFDKVNRFLAFMPGLPMANWPGLLTQIHSLPLLCACNRTGCNNEFIVVSCLLQLKLSSALCITLRFNCPWRKRRMTTDLVQGCVFIDRKKKRLTLPPAAVKHSCTCVRLNVVENHLCCDIEQVCICNMV